MSVSYPLHVQCQLMMSPNRIIRPGIPSSERDLPLVHRLTPLLIGILAENKGLVTRNDEPGIGLQFFLQLSRRPARVADGEQRLAGTLATRDRFDEPGVGRHGAHVLNFSRTLQQNIIAVQNETGFGAHRPAVVDDDFASSAFALRSDTFK